MEGHSLGEYFATFSTVPSSWMAMTYDLCKADIGNLNAIGVFRFFVEFDRLLVLTERRKPMSQEHLNPAIDFYVGEIAKLYAEIQKKKSLVNDMCRDAGRQPLYSDADLASSVGATTTRSDEYYGKPMATVVRLVLEKRQAAGHGAATVAEIYDDMLSGAYNFGGKNDENNKRTLYQSLGKNTAVFHKLPNRRYGLREWYPEIRESKPKTTNNGNGKASEKPLHEELQEEVGEDAVEQSDATKMAK